MRRLRQKVGMQTRSAYDVMLTVTQRADHDRAGQDHTLRPSRTPTYLRPSHRDEATHNVIDARATTTTRTMSTLGGTIAGATTAAT